jgi:NAD(P)-dependent dehydrogenase (short-subunit alcohol dehydrogenase family)
MKVIVVGASRGIGLELVRQYRADGAAVTGTARSASALGSQIDGAAFDVADSVAGLRRTLGALTAADNGRFLDHDGTPIEW